MEMEWVGGQFMPHQRKDSRNASGSVYKAEISPEVHDLFQMLVQEKDRKGISIY